MVILDPEHRKDIVFTTTRLIRDNHTSHVNTNYELEVNELRRDIKLLGDIDTDASVFLHHDRCVIEPTRMTIRTGTLTEVSSLYHRA